MSLKLEFITDNFLEKWTEYRIEAIILQTEVLDSIIKELDDYAVSYHYQMEGEWNHNSTYSILRLGGLEAVNTLIWKHGEYDFKTWVLYIENDKGIPIYFLEYDGYCFSGDYIAEGEDL